MRRVVSTLGIVILGALVGLLAFPSTIDGGASERAEPRRPGRQLRAPRLTAVVRVAEKPGRAAAGLDRGVVQVQGRARTFSYYAPSGLAPPSPVVLAFHGGGGTGARLRGFVGASLERLADRFGFLVAYPDGFEGHWNGCRGAARFAANTRAVDDVAFTRALLDRLAARHRLDRSQVFALGFSNGGHLVYRLALEVPGEVRAVAAFAASLPEERGIDCRPTGRPIPVMLVNGTHDRINPYAGGEVIAPGGESLGRVRSALETARYFARLAGHDETPVRATVVDPRSPDDTWVQETTWRGPGLAEVRFYTVHGGGHTLPGPRATFPAFLGSTERRFDAVDAAVRFFLWRPRYAESTSGR
jgi:polyhydroxybutyrate depolymerase